MRRLLWMNSLSLVLFGAFVVFLVLQSFFGWQAQNEELAALGQPAEDYLSYLASGSFVEATFENWESEFLQMGSYVVLTAYLVQRGSAESAPLEGIEDDPADPGQSRPDSPGPVHRGGWMLKLYENGLAILFGTLFALSFLLHLLGGTADHNERQRLLGEPTVSVAEFLGSSTFWFQSMQNWQSEFLAVGVLVVATVFLRQRRSPQSKRVAEPHSKTGV